jgi:hypothetical protein
MHKCLGALGLALVLTAGCCQNPGLFQKVQRSLETVQSYYTPLLQEEWEKNEKLRRAVVAADTTLLLAGELQRQWCPDAAQAEQLALQAREAQALARDAGVKAAAGPGD